MKLSVFVISGLIPFFCSNTAGAFDNKSTHPEITKKAANVSVLKINNCLNGYLGEPFSKGLDSIVSDRTVLAWLQKGSSDEDPTIWPAKCRASHHFHNPLLPWTQSQMTDTPFMDYICDVPRYSTVTWATGYAAPPPQGAKITVAVSPSYKRESWDSARDSYQKALTSSANADRDTYFAKTFESLGHVLHLLQDMAVPAHVRNDFASHFFRNSASFLGGFFDRFQPFGGLLTKSSESRYSCTACFARFY